MDGRLRQCRLNQVYSPVRCTLHGYTTRETRDALKPPLWRCVGDGGEESCVFKFSCFRLSGHTPQSSTVRVVKDIQPSYFLSKYEGEGEGSSSSLSALRPPAPIVEGVPGCTAQSYPRGGGPWRAFGGTVGWGTGPRRSSVAPRGEARTVGALRTVQSVRLRHGGSPQTLALRPQMRANRPSGGMSVPV